MSSSADRPRRSGPRVGIIRGATASDRPIVTDVRNRLPVEVLDPVAMQQVRRDAEDAGYADGYAAGLAKADQDAARRHQDDRQQAASLLQALSDAAAELRTREAASLDDISRQSTDLALELAACILQREIAATTDPGRDAIARAVAFVPDDGDVQVRLNPDDATALGDLADLLPGRTVKVTADPSVQRGGCVLQVESTRIDAQIPAALQRVAAVLEVRP